MKMTDVRRAALIACRRREIELLTGDGALKPGDSEIQKRENAIAHLRQQPLPHRHVHYDLWMVGQGNDCYPYRLGADRPEAQDSLR